MTTKVTSLLLANTAVTPGSYGGTTQHAVVNIDQQGRIIYAANATPSIANSQITGVMTASQLEPTTVTPGTYGSITQAPVVTVDQQGRITSAANAAITPNNLTTTNFSIVESGGKLIIKYGSTTVVSIDSVGKITSANNIVAGGTP